MGVPIDAHSLCANLRTIQLRSIRQTLTQTTSEFFFELVKKTDTRFHEINVDVHGKIFGFSILEKPHLWYRV